MNPMRLSAPELSAIDKDVLSGLERKNAFLGHLLHLLRLFEFFEYVKTVLASTLSKVYASWIRTTMTGETPIVISVVTGRAVHDLDLTTDGRNFQLAYECILTLSETN